MFAAELGITSVNQPIAVFDTVRNCFVNRFRQTYELSPSDAFPKGITYFGTLDAANTFIKDFRKETPKAADWIPVRITAFSIQQILN